MKLSPAEIQHRQRTRTGKLTPKQVAHIKWRLNNGDNKRLLAQLFEVSLWTIRSIDRGDTWAWVEADYGEGLEVPEGTPPGLTKEQWDERIAGSMAKLNEMLKQGDSK